MVYCIILNVIWILKLLYHIAGNKVNNIDVVYTPWSNLKKTASMDVGQVGFHNPKMVSHFLVYFRMQSALDNSNVQLCD